MKRKLVQRRCPVFSDRLRCSVNAPRPSLCLLLTEVQTAVFDTDGSGLLQHHIEDLKRHGQADYHNETFTNSVSGLSNELSLKIASVFTSFVRIYSCSFKLTSLCLLLRWWQRSDRSSVVSLHPLLLPSHHLCLPSDHIGVLFLVIYNFIPSLLASRRLRRLTWPVFWSKANVLATSKVPQSTSFFSVWKPWENEQWTFNGTRSGVCSI